MTVGELVDRMDGTEFMEWGQHDAIDMPESWYQTAQTCLTMVKLMGVKGMGIDDFLPQRIRPDRPADDPEEMKAKVKAFFLAKVAAQEGRPIETKIDPEEQP